MQIASGLDKLTSQSISMEPIQCVVCVKTKQRAQQRLFATECFYIDQIKHYKVMLYM